MNERRARRKHDRFSKANISKVFIPLLPVKPLLIFSHEALVLLGVFDFLLLPQGQLRHVFAVHLSQRLRYLLSLLQLQHNRTRTRKGVMASGR